MSGLMRCWMLSSTQTWIKKNPIPFLMVVVLLNFGYTKAVAECLSGNKLKCFECNSHKDEYCTDPFNWTTLPPIQVCEGCCVKIVQGMGTPIYNIRRTCTSELRINHFMVDHVCMSESNRRGRLCFCEDDLCNSAPPTAPWPSIFKNSLTLGLVVVAVNVFLTNVVASASMSAAFATLSTAS